MTKAQRILDLYGRTLGTMPKHKIPKFVAAEVGTSDAYVRTVARQRLGRGVSEAERRYLSSPLGKVKVQRGRDRSRDRYASDPDFRNRRVESNARSKAKRRAEARVS